MVWRLSALEPSSLPRPAPCCLAHLGSYKCVLCVALREEQGQGEVGQATRPQEVHAGAGLPSLRLGQGRVGPGLPCL